MQIPISSPDHIIASGCKRSLADSFSVQTLSLSLFRSSPFSAPKVTATSGPPATMASSLTYALCIVLCLCSVQTLVSAQKLDVEFYIHEIRGGPNATLLPAAGTGMGNFSALGWGSVLTIDNIITKGPEFGSESTWLGKFTGFAVMTTKGGLRDGGILVLDQFRFGPASEYNGSSLTITGNLAQAGLPTGPWEVLVLGGSGDFKGYKGYATSEPYAATTAAPRFVYKWVFYLEK